MKHKILLATLLLVLPTALAAQKSDKWTEWGPGGLTGGGWIVRVGYVIGGTSPLPVPAEIRAINSFKPLGGITFGADYYHMFTRRVGLQAGVHFFHEGFSTSADVKNYRMGITQGNNYLEGNFTGVDVTNTTLTGITIPLAATFRLSPRWNVGVGPFFSFVAKGTFDGEVTDGYLREGDPTGQKIDITADNPATYDFAANMNHFYWGLEFVFDYKAMKHLNVFGGFDWSLTSIFPKSFVTVPFNMYPLYAKIGVAYRY